MIGTDDLIKIASNKFVVNDPHRVDPTPRQPLPLEFESKDDYTFPTEWAYVLNNVNLSGTIGVCHFGNGLVLDVAYYGRLDLWERNRPYYDQALICRRSTTPITMEGVYLSLLGCWSGNYFHWTLETLPMVKAAIKYEKLYGVKPKILIDHYARQYQLDSLAAWGWTGDDVIRIDSMNMDVEKLIVAPHGRRDGYTNPAAVKFLRSNDVAAGDWKRIYISRSRSSTRKVLNEDELIQVMNGYGFGVIHLEDHPWHTQVSMLKGADFIIGPHGAGLANMVYAAPGAIVLEFGTPVYKNPCFYTLAEACWHHYYLMSGDPEPGENISIERDRLDEAIQKLTQR